MRIRLATGSDIPAIRTLIDASVRGLSTAEYTPQQIESGLRYVFGPDSQLIADGTYFVAEDGGELVGAGGWSYRNTHYGGDQMKDGEDLAIDPATEPARIRAFFVHPAFARRGIGRMLLDACTAAARAHGFTALALAATLPGVPLYAACGFTPIRSEDVILPDGVPLGIVFMQRPIP